MRIDVWPEILLLSNHAKFAGAGPRCCARILSIGGFGSKPESRFLSLLADVAARRISLSIVPRQPRTIANPKAFMKLKPFSICCAALFSVAALAADRAG